MEEQRISFETAKLAKEKGFNLVVSTAYCEEGVLRSCNPDFYLKGYHNQGMASLAPTQSLLQRWLRERHNVIVDIQLDQTSYPKYCFNIYRYEDFGNWEDVANPEWGLYSSYEKALEEALELGLQEVNLQGKNHRK